MAAAAAGVLALTGCKDSSGDAETDGNKWSVDYTIDAYSLTEGQKRAFKQMSTSSKVAGITTTITVSADDSTLVRTSNTTKPSSSGVQTTRGYACTGYLFGYVDGLSADDNTKTDSSLRDFYLLGIKPEAGVYYLERYEGVSKDAAESEEASGSLSATTIYSYIGNTWTENTKLSSADEYLITLNKNSDGNYEYTVSITQGTAGEWVVKIDDTTIATFKPEEVGNKNIGTIAGSNLTYSGGQTVDSDATYVCGGTALYGLATYGTKVKATYVVDKSNKDSAIMGTYNVDSNEVSAPTLY